jgi:hypothetical protein
VALGLQAERGALGDLLAQEVAGGEVGEVVVGLQPLGLGALAGTRRPEEDETGYRRNPS